MTDGTQTINGNKTLSGTTNLSILTASLPLQLDVSKNIISSAINIASSQITGILPIANGGTNSSTALVNGTLMISSGGQIIEGTSSSTPTFTSETLTATTNQLILGTTNTTTINSVAPASSRTYSIPDAGTNSSFVMTNGTQTINGSKTFSSAVIINPVTNQVVLGTTNTTTITAPAPASSITLTLPNSASDTIMARNTGDTMTNKTITDTTNNVAAKSLFSASTTIDVSASTAPSSGQVLIATSSTTATWQNIAGGSSMVAPTAATDANGAILSGSTLQLEFATATNPGILSVAARHWLVLRLLVLR